MMRPCELSSWEVEVGEYRLLSRVPGRPACVWLTAAASERASELLWLCVCLCAVLRAEPRPVFSRQALQLMDGSISAPSLLLKLVLPSREWDRGRERRSRGEYRDYDRNRRERFSPPRHELSPPQKRMRRDW